MTPPTPVPRDPRIAAVEHNLLAFFRLVADRHLLPTDGHADVVTSWSPIATPLLNTVAGARFAPPEAGARTRAVLAPYLERGLPFLWWATPSTCTGEMDAVLREAGLVPEPCPGMHLPLAAETVEPLPDGVTIEVVTPETSDALVHVLGIGFGLPDDAVRLFGALLDSLAPHPVLSVLARLDGEPVASGSLLVTGGTAGLYNIATLEASRGRGIGRAVTLALLGLARERGCREAVLHASSLGRSVYEQVGFKEVCQVPQYLWSPDTPVRTDV